MRTPATWWLASVKIATTTTRSSARRTSSCMPSRRRSTLATPSKPLTSKAIDASVLSPERQSRLFIDLARAHVQRRHIGEAVVALFDAERHAPEQVQTHFLVREVVGDLLSLAGRRACPPLAGLGSTASAPSRRKLGSGVWPPAGRPCPSTGGTDRSKTCPRPGNGLGTDVGGSRWSIPGFRDRLTVLTAQLLHHPTWKEIRKATHWPVSSHSACRNSTLDDATDDWLGALPGRDRGSAITGVRRVSGRRPSGRRPLTTTSSNVVPLVQLAQSSTTSLTLSPLRRNTSAPSCLTAR